MSYESPEYKKLKDEIWRLEKIKGFVDMARQFERMKYLGKMEIQAHGKITPYDPHAEAELVSVPDYMKVKIIEAAVSWCINQAEGVATIDRKEFDITLCIKV